MGLTGTASARYFVFLAFLFVPFVRPHFLSYFRSAFLVLCFPYLFHYSYADLLNVGLLFASPQPP